MTATTAITDADLIGTLSLITSKVEKLRHRVAADEQLTISEAAELAAAIEEITADMYRLAEQLADNDHDIARRARRLAQATADAAALLTKRSLRLVPPEG